MTSVWRNWARTERSAPALEVAPRGVDHVVRAVERARETGHTVKPIGASHSFTGIGGTDGVRLDPRHLRGLVDVDVERGRVTLGAGTRLHELPSMLAPLGLALENMGDIDRQTVAGAVSTGTHGTGLGFRGMASAVVGATLVTGTGDVVAVDRDRDPELLRAVALGLGALGVLVTVTLQCVPRFLLRAVEAPMPLEEVLDRHEELARGTDHFEFFWFPHTEVARTKANTRLPIEAEASPLSPSARFLDEEVMNNLLLGTVLGVERWAPPIIPRVNRLIGSLSSRRDYSDESHRVFVTHRRVRFHEMEYALPLAAIPEALRELRAVIDRGRHPVSFPVEVRAAAADDLLLSTAHGRESGYIAVHRYWRDRDHGYFREAEAVLAAHDGRPHWGKLHTRTAAELRERYPAFETFTAIRERLDPDRLFTNPYLERVLGR